MILLKQIELNDRFHKYIVVSLLNEESIYKSQQLFKEYAAKKIIVKGDFDDYVWVLSNELVSVNLKFTFDQINYSKCLENKFNLTYIEFVNSVKSYLILKIGTVSLDNIRSTLNDLKKILSNITHNHTYTNYAYTSVFSLYEFFSLLPIQSRELEDITDMLISHVSYSGKKSQRKLLNFRYYFKFNDLLNKYWKEEADINNRLFYFPIYLWWNLTAIIPLRVTEFLLTPRNCLTKTEKGYELQLRRTIKKKGTKKISYKISDDYIIQKYIIPDKLANDILEYINYTKYSYTSNIDSLFSIDPHYSFFNIPIKCNSFHYSYNNLNTCLNKFYEQVLIQKYQMIICENQSDCSAFIPENEIGILNLGDTRHLAMISLIISGGSPVICKELAYHEDINISSNYYSNLANEIECMIHQKYRLINDTSNITASVTVQSDIKEQYKENHIKKKILDIKQLIKLKKGYCSSPLLKVHNYQHCLKAIGSNGEIGYCEKCCYWINDKNHISIDYEDTNRDRFKKELTKYFAYLLNTIELVRKKREYPEELTKVMLQINQTISSYDEHLKEKYIEGI